MKKKRPPSGDEVHVDEAGNRWRVIWDTVDRDDGLGRVLVETKWVTSAVEWQAHRDEELRARAIMKKDQHYTRNHALFVDQAKKGIVSKGASILPPRWLS